MLNKITTVGASLIMWLALALPAGAQGAQFDMSGLYTAGQGTMSNTTFRTGEGPSGEYHTQVPNPTTQQIAGLKLPPTYLGGLAPVFGMSGGGSYGPWGSNGSGGSTGGGGGNGGFGSGPPTGNLASLESTLPGTTFAQYHPRRTEVLEGDSGLQNQLNADYGYLGGHYSQLSSEAQAIENQEQADAAQNGGFITAAQQAQLNQEEGALSQQISADHTNVPYRDLF